MTDQDVIEAILSGNSELITGCKVEKDCPLTISRIYQLRGSVNARYTHIAFAYYPAGIPLNSMPKDQIEIIEPDHRIIYKTDWIDEL